MTPIFYSTYFPPVFFVYKPTFPITFTLRDLESVGTCCFQGIYLMHQVIYKISRGEQKYSHLDEITTAYFSIMLACPCNLDLLHTIILSKTGVFTGYTLMS